MGFEALFLFIFPSICFLHQPPAVFPSEELGLFVLEALLPLQRLHLNVFEPRQTLRGLRRSVGFLGFSFLGEVQKLGDFGVWKKKGVGVLDGFGFLEIRKMYADVHAELCKQFLLQK